MSPLLHRPLHATTRHLLGPRNVHIIKVGISSFVSCGYNKGSKLNSGIEKQETKYSYTVILEQTPLEGLLFILD
ncbi:unnamed protein product [Brugia timori]|uniref:Ovule protein n=1 Tax=Brugia timori TaxID=42155 RepID=A0A0R3R840_9BILA|nr:unnamed protein product [Brugia timori]